MNESVRILCVDDEVNVLKALQRLFIDDNYEILTASEGRQGITLLEQHDPVQVVISDYRMPAMSGVDFLREVRERWPDTMRIVLSGYADTSAIVAAINEGQIYRFIPKPWNDDELRVTIRNVIEHYSLHQRNKQLTLELQKKNLELEKVNSDLEYLVEERTAELRFRNQVLTKSQHILDELPVAVVGVDSDGVIVQYNQKAKAWLGGTNRTLMGMNREDVFPPDICALTMQIDPGDDISGDIILNNQRFRLRVKRLKLAEGQEGFNIVLDKEEEARN